MTMPLESREAEARSALLGIEGVSRETLTWIEAYIGHLRQWQKQINLVAPSTLDHIWFRHILDSAQLFALRPGARRWLDLGSGGGVPGIVLACQLKAVGGAIDLVESNTRKAAFLRHVAYALDLPVRVHAMRIEAALIACAVPEIVTARALAPLGELLGYTKELLKSGVVALFPKGREHAMELTDAARHWHFSHVLHESRTEPEARIVEVNAFHGPCPG